MEKLKNLKVLFVEDEELVRNKFTKILEKVFASIDCAQNGKEALEKYEEALFSHPYELIITDINMPIMDGLELVKNIRNKNDQIPIIFTTARNETEYLLNAIELNVSGYLTKPIDLDKLIEKVTRVSEKILIKKALENKKHEMENIISTLDNFTAVCKFDLDGNLTFVNDIFCEYSAYSEDELLKMNIKDLVCNDANKLSFTSCWNSINSGEKWRGTIKAISKNNTEYYINNFIMPIKEDINNKIKEFICIQYLVTDNELKKRYLQNKLYQALHQLKEKEIENKQKLEELKETFEKNISENLDASKIKLLVERIKSLQRQIVHTESELKEIRMDKQTIVNKANVKVTKVMEFNNSLKRELDYYKTLTKKNKEKEEKAQSKIDELEERITEKNKRIELLLDVIDSKDKTIAELKQSSEQKEEKGS